MVTSLTRRPHWLLASLFRFQGAVVPDTGTSTLPRGVRVTVPRAPSRHSLLPPPLPLWAGPARSVRVNPPAESFSGRIGDTTGREPRLQAGSGNLCPGARYSPRPWDRVGRRRAARAGSASTWPRSGRRRRTRTPCTRRARRRRELRRPGQGPRVLDRRGDHRGIDRRSSRARLAVALRSSARRY